MLFVWTFVFGGSYSVSWDLALDFPVADRAEKRLIFLVFLLLKM